MQNYAREDQNSDRRIRNLATCRILLGKPGISQSLAPLAHGCQTVQNPLVEGHTSATDVDQDLSLVINAWHSLAEPIRARFCVDRVASN